MTKQEVDLAELRSWIEAYPKEGSLDALLVAACDEIEGLRRTAGNCAKMIPLWINNWHRGIDEGALEELRRIAGFLRGADEPAATRPCVEGRSWCDGPDVKPVEINQCSECEMLMHPERFQACSKCGGIFHTDAECTAERTTEQRIAAEDK